MTTIESADDLRTFPFDTLTSEPWRNGGGTTRTVASGGPAANSWDWRVSVADIARDGPFSIFPGIDRHLALIEGNGVVLCGDGVRMRLARLGEVVTFAGELSLDARLIDGPVRVWNLMVVRATSIGRLHEHDGSPTRLAHPDGLVRFLTVVAGSYRLRGPGIAETRVIRGKAVRLDAPMEDIQLRAVDDRAIALISDIRPLR
jgi:environmental stress-induced protein Ves